MVAHRLDVRTTDSVAGNIAAHFRQAEENPLLGPTLVVRLAKGSFKLPRGMRSIQFGPFLAFNHTERLTVARDNGRFDSSWTVSDLPEGALQQLLTALSESYGVLRGSIRPSWLTFTFSSWAGMETMANVVRPLLAYTSLSGAYGEVQISIDRPEPVKQLQIVH